ncbi:aspartyl protease family protein At5g10770-like [Musa acuminata AAA Group]|uniref:aspartyl protease family protein At5g10770-like n=1 Tax=Musa acuminata AAA Group TaxID=214697 RepID=UPI0031DB9812
MASVPCVICYLALLIASLGICWQVHGGGITHQHVTIRSLLPSDACSSYKDGDGVNHNETSLTVLDRHGPCSPFDLHHQLSHKQILDHDQSRVDSLHGRVSTAPKQDQQLDALAASSIPAHSGISLGTGNYVVIVGFGTPKRDQTVIFDTGSDVTWIQCQPCVVTCYHQQDPIFDPSHSSTYLNISCSSAYCTDLAASGCSSSTCVYGVQYGDNSYTVGFYAEDTLWLTPYDVIPNFRFGCGERNDGLFGKAAGLIGLGRDKPSFVSQTYQRYGGVFTYCLPPTSSSTGYLKFGGGYPSSDLRFTPMLSGASSPTFYYLTLTAISVGGQQLLVPPTVFSVAGTIIDSGTVITRLPPTAYSALRSAFRQEMTTYKSAPALSILDTCYDLSGLDKVTVPEVALHLGGGATIHLDITRILYIASLSQACLAFAANRADTDLGIIGNVQQRGLDVVYDVSKHVIGFGPGGC